MTTGTAPINGAGGAIRPDFHTHSKFSDGVFTPHSLLSAAAQAGITMLALTDHDSMSGLPEAKQAADLHGISLLPGVEISTAGEMEVHLLAYHVNEKMDGLKALLVRMKQDRDTRGLRFLDRLKSFNIHITLADLELGPDTPFNRPSLARAMVRKGYVASEAEAFHRYLEKGKPAYIPRLKADTVKTISMLREEGALPVLAHPVLIDNPLIGHPSTLPT